MQLESKLPVMLVFLGLLTQADREGRFRWQPKILKLAILPFIPFDMEAALDRLVAGGYLRKYAVDGKMYGDIPTFSDHQTVNSHEKGSFYPEYSDAYACTCMNVHAHVEGKGREKEGNGKRNWKAPSESEQAEPASPEFLRIPLNRGEYSVREREIREWESLYPAVDVRQEVREILAWNLANPTRRKTASGVREHIRRWLSKAQDVGGSRRGNNAADRSSESVNRAGAVGRVERTLDAWDRSLERLRGTGAGVAAQADERLLPSPGISPGHD